MTNIERNDDEVIRAMTKERISYVDHEVVDENHNTVGKVTDVIYGDDETAPQWLVVKPGVLAKERYVPIEGSYESDEGNIVVPFDKSGSSRGRRRPVTTCSTPRRRPRPPSTSTSRRPDAPPPLRRRREAVPVRSPPFDGGLRRARTASQSSSLRALMNTSPGTSTRPIAFIFFLPSFCFSSSLRLRVMSPP